MDKDRIRFARMMKYRDLRLKMLAYEERYFRDMRFQEAGLIRKLTLWRRTGDRSKKVFTDDSWTMEFTLRRWLITHIRKDSKFGRELVGRCDPKRKMIIVRRDRNPNNENNTVLHEMIHAYEAILPNHLRQLMLLHLENRLSKQIGPKRLREYIYMDSHIDIKEHTPLFLLKSLDLDLRTKQALGTIYAYGRAEFFGG